MPRNLVLGIDPGFASLGFALLELGGPRDGSGLVPDLVIKIGVIRTTKTDKKQKVLSADDNTRRCRELARALRALFVIGAPARGAGVAALFEAGDVVRLVCAEKMSFPRNASAAAKVAMTWGLIMGHVDLHDLPLLQASPQDVKKRVTGNASASKEDIERAMVKKFGRGLYRMLKGVPPGQHEHAFDALASAVACLDSDEARIVRGFR